MSDNRDKDIFIEGEYELLEVRDMEDKGRQSYERPYLITDPKPPYVTYALLASNIIAYLLMTIIGLFFGWDLNQQLYVLGAKVNILIAHGQYWRLFTAMFLHVGLVHLFFNSYALYIYGPIVEKLFGKTRFALIYIGSGLYGSLSSYLFSSNPAAGASGAIFGLMGSLLYFRQRKKDSFRRIFGPQLIIIILINLFYGSVQPSIDNWGHIGGLVGGYLIANSLGLYKEDGVGGFKVFLWTLLIVIFLLGLYVGRHKHFLIAI